MLSYRYLIAFGSNKGDRVAHCSQGLFYLCSHVQFLAMSSWRKTAPLAHSLYSTQDHEWYLNFVCEVVSLKGPYALYQQIQKVENTIGHSRVQKWLPRQLDIDILFCAINDGDSFVRCTPFPFVWPPDFSVPHIGYPDRPFLQTLVEHELKIPPSLLKRHFIEKAKHYAL
jgi:2-amino-4-hydroxy-6-hydroxymethyldihydropteridine diphosphokinase